MNADFQQSQPLPSRRCRHGALPPCSPANAAFPRTPTERRDYSRYAGSADPTKKETIHPPFSILAGRPAAAFTLIEVCIAVAVAGVTLVTLLAVLGDAMAHGRRASDETKATLIQQRIMRDLRSQPFGSSIGVPSDGGGPTAHTVSLTGSNVYTWSFGRDLQYLGTGSPDGRYFLAQLLAVTNGPSLTRISLAVTWIDGQPRPTTNTLHTWVGQRE